MRTLVVTARKAADTVRAVVGEMAQVLVLDIDIAAFATPNRLKNSLPAEEFDLIIIPGLISADFSGLEAELGIPIRLGSRHAIDLGRVLTSLEDIELSASVPACELLTTKHREDALMAIRSIESSATAPLLLNDLKIGGDSIMKVMAEVVDATALSRDKLVERIGLFLAKGADIIDLGVGMDATPDQVRAAVEEAKHATTVPISIDTLQSDLIIAAVESGVDLVLSLNSSNIDAVGPLIARQDIAAVVIPDPGSGPDSLINNIKMARNIGINKIIADPVLDPPGQGMVDSILRYRQFRQLCPEVPLFFGVGNITELMDADSVGLNALLTAICSELGAHILFTPEYSHKARGSISELKTAAWMMALARQRDSPPKDLGLDLLVLKEKRFRPFGVLPRDHIEAKGSYQWTRDPAGSFKISITGPVMEQGAMKPGRIIARHTKYTLVGDNAKDIFDTASDMGLVSRLDHAAYLGRELMKAELALRLGRSYSQDDEF